MNTTVTGPGGYYVFENVNDWGYYNITEVQQTGYTLTDPASGWHSHIYVNGIPVTTQYNFTNDRQNGTLSGYKFDETGAGLPGWTIRLYNATTGNLVNSTETGAGGYYEFENINDWGWYNITEVQQAGWQLTSPPGGWHSDIYISEQPIAERYNFTNEQLFGYISGFKIQAETGLGVPNWTIEAYNQTGSVFVNSAVTNATGFYNITGCPCRSQ